MSTKNGGGGGGVALQGAEDSRNTTEDDVAYVFAILLGKRQCVGKSLLEAQVVSQS